MRVNNLVFVKICEFLDLKSIFSISLTCKEFYKMTKLEGLWKKKSEMYLEENGLEMTKDDVQRFKKKI